MDFYLHKYKLEITKSIQKGNNFGLQSKKKAIILDLNPKKWINRGV